MAGICDPTVLTALRHSGYLSPIDCIRLSATCKPLADFCSRDCTVAKQLLQQANCIIHAHVASQRKAQYDQTQYCASYGELTQLSEQLSMTEVNQLVASILFHAPTVNLYSAVLMVAAGLWTGGQHLAAAAAREVPGHEVWYIAHQWLMAVHVLRSIGEMCLLREFLEVTPLNWLQCLHWDVTGAMSDEVKQLSLHQVETLLHLALRLQSQPQFKTGPSHNDTWVGRAPAFVTVIGSLQNPGVWGPHQGSVLSQLDQDAIVRLLQTAVSVTCAPHLHQPTPRDCNKQVRLIHNGDGEGFQIMWCFDRWTHGFGSMVSCLQLLFVTKHMDAACCEGIWQALAEQLDSLQHLKHRVPEASGATWRRWQYLGELTMLSDSLGNHTFIDHPQAVASVLKYKIATGSISDLIHIHGLVAKAVLAGTVKRLTSEQLYSLVEAAQAVYAPDLQGSATADDPSLHSVEGLQAILYYARLKSAVLRSVEHPIAPHIVIECCKCIIAKGLDGHFCEQQVKGLCDMLYRSFMEPALKGPGLKPWICRVLWGSELTSSKGTLADLQRVADVCCWFREPAACLVGNCSRTGGDML